MCTVGPQKHSLQCRWHEWWEVRARHSFPSLAAEGIVALMCDWEAKRERAGECVKLIWLNLAGGFKVCLFLQVLEESGHLYECCS